MNDAQDGTAPQPRFFAAYRDPQREAVLRAEEETLEHCYAYGYDQGFFEPEQVAADELQAFARSALVAAGWTCGSDEPTFVLDVPDEADYSAWHEGATGIIHLHPMLLNQDIVLHELAHWCHPTNGHDAQFCGFLVELWHAVFGWEAAYELRSAFRDFQANVEDTWHSLDLTSGRAPRNPRA
jgi:hypothetical protein